MVNHIFNLLKFITINSIHDIAKVFTLVADFTFYLQLLSCVFFPLLMFPLIKYVEEETQDPGNIGTDNDTGAKQTKVGTTTCIYGEQYNFIVYSISSMFVFYSFQIFRIFIYLPKTRHFICQYILFLQAFLPLEVKRSRYSLNN